MVRDVHPDPDLDFLPILDPGSRVQKSPDLGSGSATLLITVNVLTVFLNQISLAGATKSTDLEELCKFWTPHYFHNLEFIQTDFPLYVYILTRKTHFFIFEGCGFCGKGV